MQQPFSVRFQAPFLPDTCIPCCLPLCLPATLLRRLHAVFPDTQESVIYAILRQLCREGCTERYQGETSGGPARKYYRLTGAGRERYAALLAAWRETRDALTALGIE